jgi:hypothetical protein
MELHTQIEIDAPAEVVWKVLTDLPRFGEWNPFIREAVGIIAPGERLTVRLKPPDGTARTFRPRVLEAEAPRTLRWLGRLGVAGLLDGEHAFEIESITEQRVRFTQSERFRGILVPLFRTMIEGDTRRGFEAMNLALKQRAEGTGR